MVRIAAPSVPCGISGALSLDLDPGLPIQNDRFEATDLPLPGGNQLDIDGVLFDADEDGSAEQALGGFSVVRGLYRCNEQWVATALADADTDGWADVGERHLGSSPVFVLSTPEHRLVPTTDRFGPGPCRDFLDNDGGSGVDEADPKCAPLPAPHD